MKKSSSILHSSTEAITQGHGAAGQHGLETGTGGPLSRMTGHLRQRWHRGVIGCAKLQLLHLAVYAEKSEGDFVSKIKL